MKLHPSEMNTGCTSEAQRTLFWPSDKVSSEAPVNDCCTRHDYVFSSLLLRYVMDVLTKSCLNISSNLSMNKNGRIQ